MQDDSNGKEKIGIRLELLEKLQFIPPGVYYEIVDYLEELWKNELMFVILKIDNNFMELTNIRHYLLRI